MDPEQNLKEQLQLARMILEAEEGDDATDRLAELVVALDEWLSSGGALPSEWQRRDA